MYGLSIYEIKMICQHAHFFYNLTWKFSAFYKFSEKNPKSLILSFSICNRHPASLFFFLLFGMTSSFLENVKIHLFSIVLSRYCMIYFGNTPQKRISIFRVNYILKYLTLKNYFFVFISFTVIWHFRKKRKIGVSRLIFYLEGQM